MVNVDVSLSDQFFGWIFALGTKVKIERPKEVVERFKGEILGMDKLYD